MPVLPNLVHCFGTSTTTPVDTSTAVAMLRASKCRYLAINTHNIATVLHGDELPVGYGSATFGSVRIAFAQELMPVLNINMPTTSEEAVARARLAHELTGENIVKLEVLDEDLGFSVNAAVLEAARTLIGDGRDVWPLITPDAGVAKELEEMGCSVIRIMGSAIGSARGIDPKCLDDIRSILESAEVPTMLDGGVGCPEHAQEALAMGFDSVLVNSCLFRNDEPSAELARFAAMCSGNIPATARRVAAPA